MWKLFFDHTQISFTITPTREQCDRVKNNNNTEPQINDPRITRDMYKVFYCFIILHRTNRTSSSSSNSLTLWWILNLLERRKKSSSVPSSLLYHTTHHKHLQCWAVSYYRYKKHNFILSKPAETHLRQCNMVKCRQPRSGVVKIDIEYVFGWGWLFM